jgi:hypothetical protein
MNVKYLIPIEYRLGLEQLNKAFIINSSNFGIKVCMLNSGGKLSLIIVIY